MFFTKKLLPQRAKTLTLKTMRHRQNAEVRFTAMSKYRARLCPRCGYYQAYIIGKPLPKHAETPITGFCLNCEHRLPVVGFISGRRNPKPLLRRIGLRLVKVNTGRDTLARDQKETHELALRNAFVLSNYSRHLRVIGQQLEAEHWPNFNLGCTQDGYEVFGRIPTDKPGQRPIFSLGKQQLQRLWHSLVPTAEAQARSDDKRQHTHFTLEDLEQRDRIERGRRRTAAGQTNGHTVSQLLRTIGALISQRNQRLLAISWQELSICIVVETNEGRKEVEVYRPDNLYDSWVRCYLKRGYQASSDQTR